MSRIAVCCLMFSSFCSFRETAAEDAMQIRQLIPAAAAMSKADMDKLATSNAPSYDDIEDKSLTLQLFAMKLNRDRTEEQLAEYRTLADVPKPSDLAAEIYRVRRIGRLVIPLGPITAIHAERITDFTCELDGDQARGTVTYKVPDLYQGKVNYVAQQSDDTWRITEFILPAHNIHVVRGADGSWTEKK